MLAALVYTGHQQVDLEYCSQDQDRDQDMDE